MRTFLIVLRKDLLRKVRSPLAPIAMLLFPIVFSLLIGMTFGGGEKMAPIKIALVDEDQGLVSRLVRPAFSQNQMPMRFEIEDADSADAIRLIERNKISAAVRIPEGFSDRVLAGETTYLEVVRNPAQGIYPDIVEQYVRVLAQLGSAASSILSEPIDRIRGSIDDGVAPNDETITMISLLMNKRMSAVGKYAFPPLINLEGTAEVEESVQSDQPGRFRIAAYILPGMATFALIMLAIVAMADLHREGALGTLSRQIVAPVRLRSVILGKIGAVLVLLVVCVAILMLLASLWAETRFSIPGFLVLSIAFGLMATGFACFIQSISRSERTGSTIGSIIVMLMSMLGGAWLPIENMGAFVQKIAPFTPIYWGIKGYRILLFDSGSLADVAPVAGILLGIGVVLTTIAIFRIRQIYGSGT